MAKLELFGGFTQPKRNKLYDPQKGINQENLPYEDDSWFGKVLGRDGSRRNAEALLAMSDDLRKFGQQDKTLDRTIKSQEGLAEDDRKSAFDRLAFSLAGDKEKMSLADQFARARDEMAHMFDKENFMLKFGHDKEMSDRGFDNDLRRMGFKNELDTAMQKSQFDFTNAQNRDNKEFQIATQIAQMLGEQPKNNSQIRYYDAMAQGAGATADLRRENAEGVNWRNNQLKSMLGGAGQPTGQPGQVVGRIAIPGFPAVQNTNAPVQPPVGNPIANTNNIDPSVLSALKLLQGWTARGGQ